MSWFSKQENEEAEGQNDGSPFGLSEEEQLQKQIFISTFAMLSKLASSDGKVSKTEAMAVDRFMRNALELDDDRRTFAAAVFNKARKSSTSFEDFAKQYYALLKDKPRMFEWMVDVLLKVSLSDEVYSQSEEDLINKACGIFGINEERYQQLRSRHVKASDTLPYEILGCTASSSDDEIKEKYRTLQAEYDPARIKELGLPEEFIVLAEEKYKAIVDTYKAIAQSRRFDN